MKVLLLTEGTYPIARGGVSTWCDHLMSRLDDIRFDILALGPTGSEPSMWTPPHNVDSVTIHGVWGRPPSMVRRRRARRCRRAIDNDLYRMWLAVLADDGMLSSEAFRRALRNLVTLEDEGADVAAALAAEGSGRALLRAWSQVHERFGWPAMSVAQAVEAAAIVDRTLGLISVPMPAADVVHATANGPCGLLAVAAAWRGLGAPMLTEHGIYLREQYIALRRMRLDWAVRKALTAFTRRLCTTVLQEVRCSYPVSDFNRTWLQELGAHPDRIVTIRNGVDVREYAPLEEEPAEPTISFVGRIDPLKDLETLVRAHAIVTEQIPGTRLRLFGPIPEGNEVYAERIRAVVAELGTQDLVTWEGPVAGSRPALEAGQVIALSSISEGMPYTLIEALMCGRATVSTDVGGVNECLRPDGAVGYLVPPRQPAAFAAACTALLADRPTRRLMGERAARWARARFDLADFAVAYRGAYEWVARTGALGPEPVVAEVPTWYAREEVHVG